MAKAITYKGKNIGKPYAGKPHVRFDAGGAGFTSPLLYNRREPTSLNWGLALFAIFTRSFGRLSIVTR